MSRLDSFLHVANADCAYEFACATVRICTCIQSWALAVLKIFFNEKKLYFCIFYQVYLTGDGLFK